MKLNNKGFAFSTILYGCFSLIVIILLILLSIMRTSVQFTDYYSEKIKNNLTNCLEEEIALENCYATSQICDTKAYAACMGYDEVGEVQNAYSLKDTLDKIISLNGQGTNGLYKEGNKFLYKGNADATIYNYLTYEGELFRIISVDESGQIKALYKGFDENISFDKDNTGSVTYSASSIRQVLNNSVINIFPNKELFVQKLVSENTVLLTSTSTYKTLQSGEIKNNTTEVNYLTLLEIEDIVNASQTLLEIVGNILDINKIEADKVEIIDDVYNFRTAVSNYNTIGYYTQSAKDDPNNIDGRSLDFYIEGTASANWVSYTNYAGFPAFLYFDLWSNTKLINTDFNVNNMTSYSFDIYNPNDFAIDVVAFNLSRTYFPFNNGAIKVYPKQKSALQVLVNKYFMQNELLQKLSYISICVDYDKTVNESGELYWEPCHLYLDNFKCTIDKTSIRDSSGFVNIPKTFKDESEILSFSEPTDLNYVYTAGNNYAKLVVDDYIYHKELPQVLVKGPHFWHVVSLGVVYKYVKDKNRRY